MHTQILLGTSEGKIIIHGRINIGCEDVDWIQQAKDSQWRVPIKFVVPYKAGNFSAY
jgi:hypothetical protein